MNKHLNSVRSFHDAFLFPQADLQTNQVLSDIEIINYQALLMNAACEILQAMKAGEMLEILVGLIDLAYVALAAIAKQGGDVSEQVISWQLDGFVLSVLQILSEKINHCVTGKSDSYSAVYTLCIHLTRGFVNADFDKAFQMIHQNNIAYAKKGESFYRDAENFQKQKVIKAPDLSECLYE